MMAKGASYSDQAVLSLNKYPLMFKIFIVPFLDMHYLKRLGKSKTLVLISGTALFLLLFIFGANSEQYIENKNIWAIVSLWFLTTVFGVLFISGAHVWTLTLLKDDRRHMGGILHALGVSFGMTIGFNLFVVLNSKDWWNENIFKNGPWKLEREIVTHKGFIRSVSLIVLLTTIYCIFFVKEKVVDSSRIRTLTETFKTTNRMLQISPIFKMLSIVFLDQVFFHLFSKSVELKFIDYGVDKADLVNIQSTILPFKIALMSLAPFFAVESHLFRQVLGFQTGSISGALILLALVCGLSNGSEANWGWMFAGFFLRELVFIIRQLMFSKVTEVIPVDIGATAYTIFATLNNTAENLPPSIGLKVVDLMSEQRFFQAVLGSLIVQLIVICLLWPWAGDVDKAKIEEFRIIGQVDEGVA